MGGRDPKKVENHCDRELFAKYDNCKQFIHLLEGRNFKIYIDHKPLLHVFQPKKQSERQQRQLSYLYHN